MKTVLDKRLKPTTLTRLFDGAIAIFLLSLTYMHSPYVFVGFSIIIALRSWYWYSNTPDIYNALDVTLFVPKSSLADHEQKMWEKAKVSAKEGYHPGPLFIGSIEFNAAVLMCFAPLCIDATFKTMKLTVLTSPIQTIFYVLAVLLVVSHYSFWNKWLAVYKNNIK